MAFCSECGARLNDGFAFCTQCGAGQTYHAGNNTAAGVAANESDFQGFSEAVPQKPLLKSLPNRLLPAIIAVCALAVLAVAAFVWPGFILNLGEDTAYVIYYDLDGNAQLLYEDGSVKTIEGDFDRIIPSSHLDGYVLLEDGELYMTDNKLKNRVDISDDCDELSACLDSFLFYIEDGNTVIYDAEKDDSLELKGSFSGGIYYGNQNEDDGPATDMFFVTDDSCLWHFTTEDFDIELLAETEGMSLLYCMDDASQLFYSSLVGTTDTLYAVEDGKIEKLDSCELDNTYIQHTYSEYGTNAARNADVAVIGNSNSDKVFMISGSDLEKVKIPQAYIYTACVEGVDGLYEYDSEEAPEGVYLASYNPESSYDDDNCYKLWYVDFNGKAKEISEMADSSFAILDDTIYYFTAEHELSCAKLSGSKMRGSELIDDAVLDFGYTGDSVYYLTDCDLLDEDQNIGKGSVYRINPELDKPVKVDKKAACMYFTFDSYDGSKYESGYLYWPDLETKDSIFTYHSMEYIDYDEYKWEAVLALCDKNGEGAEETEKVMPYSSVMFDNDLFVIEQYVKTKSGKDVVNVLYYNGKEFETVLEDVWSILYR